MGSPVEALVAQLRGEESSYAVRQRSAHALAALLAREDTSDLLAGLEYLLANSPVQPLVRLAVEAERTCDVLTQQLVLSCLANLAAREVPIIDGNTVGQLLSRVLLNSEGEPALRSYALTTCFNLSSEETVVAQLQVAGCTSLMAALVKSKKTSEQDARHAKGTLRCLKRHAAANKRASRPVSAFRRPSVQRSAPAAASSPSSAPTQGSAPTQAPALVLASAQAQSGALNSDGSQSTSSMTAQAAPLALSSADEAVRRREAEAERRLQEYEAAAQIALREAQVAAAAKAAKAEEAAAAEEHRLAIAEEMAENQAWQARLARESAAETKAIAREAAEDAAEKMQAVEVTAKSSADRAEMAAIEQEMAAEMVATTAALDAQHAAAAKHLAEDKRLAALEAELESATGQAAVAAAAASRSAEQAATTEETTKQKLALEAAAIPGFNKMSDQPTNDAIDTFFHEEARNWAETVSEVDSLLQEAEAEVVLSQAASRPQSARPRDNSRAPAVHTLAMNGTGLGGRNGSVERAEEVVDEFLAEEDEELTPRVPELLPLPALGSMEGGDIDAFDAFVSSFLEESGDKGRH